MSVKHLDTSRPFTLRLTQAERAELERRAGEMALGAYIKAVVFNEGEKRARRGARTPIKDHVRLAEVLACLGQSRLSTNITELAEAAKHGTLYVDDSVSGALKRACDDICSMRMLLMIALGIRVPDGDLIESVSQSFTRAAREGYET